MSFGTAIKKLRQDAGLSQQEVAGKLGMARATYASLEVDRREPDLGELKAFSDFYEISLIELIAEEGDDWPGVIHEPVVQYNIREGSEELQSTTNQQLDPVKLREVLLYVLAKVGAMPNFGEAELRTLLYMLDAEYTVRHGRSITGIAYVRGSHGPTLPKVFVDIVKQMQTDGELEVVTTNHFKHMRKKYLPVVSTDLQHLSASELRCIENVLGSLSDEPTDFT